MSEARNNGGPAYPVTAGHEVYTTGMSLRDWFAGQALAEATREIWAEHKFEDVAKRAYDIADAMLAEREKQP